jgi:predicted dehydrogenase
MVGHILEFHPAIIKLKELIDKGSWGIFITILELIKILGRYEERRNPVEFRSSRYIRNDTALNECCECFGKRR